MSKKIVILGGGTGTSTLVRGLKEFPVDISVVVSVCDDGSSTGKLREEFDIPAVGDLRKVLSALSDTEPLFESLLEYRFNTSSDLNGHAVGNLLLAALCNITGNMSDGIKSLSKVLNLKGKVLPLSEDNVVLMGIMNDGEKIEGEHNITEYKSEIKDIYYKTPPKINPEVIKEIKEAEKNSIMEEFKDKQDELVVGILTREDENNYFVDLGRICGILPKSEIIPGEKLVMESSVKAYISKLELGTKGQLILLSRTHYGFLKRLLELEIPELSDGSIFLYSVARDAGSRSKISVYSENSNIDPVGAIIGGKGARINRISKELNGEKIDVILYDKDPIKFIQNALSPAKNVKVIIKDPKKQEALAIVDQNNLSLAIGKKGQNVKLAARLTHYKIDVKTEEQAQKENLI